MEPTLVTTEAELSAVAAELADVPRIALDIESNGLFVYRATLCVIQIASERGVVVVDALATPLAPLGPLLASKRTIKIVHDVGFDARILSEAGMPLDSVCDTSIAARMLGRTATGLASLLSSELGITLDKKMQHHDWTQRPLTSTGLTYLVSDVAHLETLADRLLAEVEERGIGKEIDEETRYRVAQATAAAGTVDPRPPWARLKGVLRVPAADLPILRRIADLREERARELDVPPYKILAPDVLFAIAREKPRTMDALSKIRGATQGSRARGLAKAMLECVAQGIDEKELSRDEKRWLESPRLPGELVRARRARADRLTKWRRDAAKARAVDEQVVLPGHCLQDLADIDDASTAAIAGVPGIGAFRVERDGAALLDALRGPETSS